MAKNSTIIEAVRKEWCPVCCKPVERMLTHLPVAHPAVRKCGDLLWLNRHEVIYNGRHYKRDSSTEEN